MQIIRQFRSSLSIIVKENGEVIIKAPFLLSSKKINDFVKSKEKWITKQIEKQSNFILMKCKYDFENYIYINNIKTDIHFSSKKEKAKIYQEKWEEIIHKKASEIAKSHGFKASFVLCNSKCIWGSCNQDKRIKLNWKLVILPENLQYYIICHELCHIKQMNHSKKFWEEVEKMDKDYKKDRKELKNYGSILREQIL